MQLLAVMEQVAQMLEQLLQVTLSDMRKVPSIHAARQEEP